MNKLFYPKSPLFLPTLKSYIFQSRFYLFALLWIRFAYFMILKKGKISKLSTSKGHHLEEVIRYQFKENNNMMFFVRARIESLIYPLLCIPGVRNKLKTAKLLSIGPRNEGELLLLNGHGFGWQNLQAVDLFSYSPKISVMDMHDLKFSNNSFDIVISSWVLRYSYSIQKAVDEIIRVSKNGAYVVVGFSWADEELDSSMHDKTSVGSKLRGGLKELLSYFNGHIDTICWQMEEMKERQGDVSLIFRVKK